MLLSDRKKGLRKASNHFGCQVRHREETHGVKGHITFFVTDVEGNILREYKSPNVIVNTASVLIARLLKGEPGVRGITHLAVGTGGSGWDLQDPPAPTTTQQRLEGEILRKKITKTAFIDPETGNETLTPTNIVDYSFCFSESEAVGSLVEMGLFGGDATDSLNSGVMLNYRTFPVLNKTNSMAFVIIVRITT